jgi:hypothetical protein
MAARGPPVTWRRFFSALGRPGGARSVCSATSSTCSCSPTAASANSTPPNGCRDPLQQRSGHRLPGHDQRGVASCECEGSATAASAATSARRSSSSNRQLGRAVRGSDRRIVQLTVPFVSYGTNEIRAIRARGKERVRLWMRAPYPRPLRLRCPQLVEPDGRVDSSRLTSTGGSVEPDQLPTSGLAVTRFCAHY